MDWLILLINKIRNNHCLLLYGIFFLFFPLHRPLVVEAVAAPAAEEVPSPSVVDGGDDGSVSPPAGASAAAVVSSDDTSGKEDTAEGGSAVSCGRAWWILVG